MNSSSSNKPNYDYAVILVTYNSRDEVLTCLQSLPDADPGARFQIIIVDNHSADGTVPAVRRWAETSPDNLSIDLIENARNWGFTHAVNQGLARADAQWIVFLNPDTQLPENALRRLREVLQQRPDIGVIAPQLRNPDGSVQPSCRRFVRHRDVWFHFTGLAMWFPRSRRFNGWKMGDFDHRSPREVDQPQGAFLLARRDVVQSVGEWDERFPMFFSDVDWCRRVKQAGYRIWFEPSVQVFHHKGRSVFANRPPMILTSHRSFVRYFWKYYPQPRYFLLNAATSLLLWITGWLRYVFHRLFRRR